MKVELSFVFRTYISQTSYNPMHLEMTLPSKHCLWIAEILSLTQHRRCVPEKFVDSNSDFLPASAFGTVFYPLNCKFMGENLEQMKALCMLCLMD